MSYYLHYDAGTGAIVSPYHSAVHGKEIPIYNTELINDDEGNMINDIGTVQIGVTLDLSAIPTPYIAITDAEHDEWMQNQSTRKIDIETKKLVEHTPPTPSAEAILAQRIVTLDAEYQPQFAELSSALGMATLAGNNDLIISIKTDYMSLKAEYDTKRGEINGN